MNLLSTKIHFKVNFCVQDYYILVLKGMEVRFWITVAWRLHFLWIEVYLLLIFLSSLPSVHLRNWLHPNWSHVFCVVAWFLGYLSMLCELQWLFNAEWDGHNSWIGEDGQVYDQFFLTCKLPSHPLPWIPYSLKLKLEYNDVAVGDMRM